MSIADHVPRFASRADQRMWSERIPAAWWIVGLILLLLPIVIAGPGHYSVGRLLPLPKSRSTGRPILPLE